MNEPPTKPNHSSVLFEVRVDDKDLNRLNRTGSHVIYVLLALFAWDLVAPYFFGTVAGDANSRAVLANLLIAVCSFLFGTNVGRNKTDMTIANMSEVAKKAVPVDPTPPIIVGEGEKITVEGKSND